MRITAFPEGWGRIATFGLHVVPGRGLLAFVLALGLLACADKRRALPAPNEPPAAAHEGAAAASVRSAYIALRQSQAANDAAYRIDGGRTSNPDMGVREEYGPDRVALSSVVGPWRASLGLEAYGCSAMPLPVRVGPRVTRGNRVEYARGPVTEWYVNGPLGVEHGFTLTTLPTCVDDDVVLDVEVKGLSVRRDRSGSGVDLADAEGTVRVHYTDLVARDAAGRTLIATMTATDGGVAIHVGTRGAALPIVVDPLLWVPQELSPSDGRGGFGMAVSMTSDTALVGANGAVYVFVLSGSSWVQQGGALTASDGAADFGESLSLSGDTALVGGISGNQGQGGAAYVFVRTGSTWSQQGPPLVSSDDTPGDRFGASVSLSGDTAIVGAPTRSRNGLSQGAAYVFVRTGSSWSQQGPPIQAPDPGNDAGRPSDFGCSVAVSGDTALVGESGWSWNGTDQGAAYVFVRNGANWTQQGPAITALDGAADDSFGNAVALDGDTALIGAETKYLASSKVTGTAYVFVRNGSTWTQQGELVAAGASSVGYVGWSVALSGDVALLGAPFDGNGGAMYVFTRTGSTWTQDGTARTAPDEVRMANFGYSVAVSGQTALVGAMAQAKAYVSVLSASLDGGAAADAGVALQEVRGAGNSVSLSGGRAAIAAPPSIFVRTDAGWIPEAPLDLPDADGGIGIGSPVSLSGDTCLVGYSGAFGASGAAGVFVRNGSTWTQQGDVIRASDGAYGDYFGASVSLDGDTALIGANHKTVGSNYSQGEVYVFVRSGSTWSPQGPPLTVSEAGANDAGVIHPNNFGFSVSVSGDTALIGAPTVATLGAVYVFVRNGSTWTQQGPALTASDGAGGDFFGASVSLSGDTALISSTYKTVGANKNQGAAYVFVRSGGTWTQQGPALTTSDGASGDDFGEAVSVLGDVALVGAAMKTQYSSLGTNVNQGAAYLFVRNGTVWTQHGPALLPPDGTPNAYFGATVSLSSDTALVGASGSHAAYFFPLGSAPPDAGIGGDAAGPSDSGAPGMDATIDASGESGTDATIDASGMPPDSGAAGGEPTGGQASCGCHTAAVPSPSSAGLFLSAFGILWLRRGRNRSPGSGRSDR